MSLRLALLLAGAWIVWAASAFAQLDHLECYKLDDSAARVRYTADLNGLTVQPDCVVKGRAKLLCVPASKTNVVPAPPGAPSGPATGPALCYKVKCPAATAPPVVVTDQFGSRPVTPRVPKLLCAPATIGTTTSTTLPGTRCCQGIGGPLCSDLPGVTAASTCGGTLAAAGLVCDGATGNCAASRSGVSSCCQVLGPICFEGPTAALACTVSGASVVPGVACLSTGNCAAP
jgi:hypothetical protein